MSRYGPTSEQFMRHYYGASGFVPKSSQAKARGVKVNPLFEVHRLNEPGLDAARDIANKFDNLLLDLEKVCGTGREFAIVKTKLEEACFFAKKAMASQKTYQA